MALKIVLRTQLVLTPCYGVGSGWVMFIYRIVTILVIVAVFAVVVCAQLTVVERGLRRLPSGEGAICRVILSIVNAMIGFAIFLGVQITLCVIVNGDYRQPIFGIYDNAIPVCGGLFGLSVPWLPLVLKAYPNNSIRP